MSNIYPLKGKIQQYAWGGQSFIPDLLNLKPNGKPYAEYWLGAYANAPSSLSLGISGEVPLDGFIAENPEVNLGSSINQKFGRLPFLFKVLDVEEMLSIQVHPTKAQAENGFKKENEKGIAVEASNRSYKDDNHKPEIMVALSDFWLLHGFLSPTKLKSSLVQIPELSQLTELFEKEGYYGLYKNVMEQSDEERIQVLGPLIARITPLYMAGSLDKANPDYWAARAALAFNSDVPDRGIYSIYFFNIVNLEPGRAIFQDAGIPHAYLEGQNIELMTNSDNVLRGGLTSKHVNVSELLKLVVFKETIPNIMSGELQPDGLEKIFKSPAPDFQLSMINLKKEDIYMHKADAAQILMVLEGESELRKGANTLMFKKGDAVFVGAGCDYVIQAQELTVVYKATTPF